MDVLSRESDRLLVEGRPRARKLIDEFKLFIQRGSFFELAVALVVGEAFTSIVKSFVNDIFAPVLSLLLTNQLSEVFIVMKSGPNAPYVTRDEATADGAVTWNYGNFIQMCINFFVMSLALFVFFKMYTIVLRQVRELEERLDLQ